MPQNSSWFAKLVCIAFMLLTLLLAWQGKQFEIDASADTLLTANNQHYIISQVAEQRYGAQEFILIAYQPKNNDIFSAKTLNNVIAMSDKIAEIERVDHVRSIANVPIFTQAQEFSGDVNALSWQQQKFSQKVLQQSLKSHPLYEGLLINQQQNALSLQVVFKQHETLEQLKSDITAIKQHLLTRELTNNEQQQLANLKKKQEKINKKLDKTRIAEIKEIRQLLQEFTEPDEVYLGGNNLLAYELITIIQNDLAVFGGIILCVVIVLLSYLFRQFSWVFLPIFCCAASVVLTLGLLALLGLKVTVISANVIALQIILSLAMIIHLIVQYQEFVKEDSTLNQYQLVLATMKSKIKPCLFAGLTTTVGFATLIFSSVQPVISFGWMMVVAMGVSLVVSLVFFPALLLAFFPVQGKVVQHPFIEKNMAGFAHFTQQRAKLITTFTLVISTVVGLGCVKLTAENSFLNYFASSTDVHRELTFIDQQFGGSTSFDVLYKIPPNQQRKDLVLTADAVQTITNIQTMLAGYKAIGNITSVADFTRIAQVVNGKPLTEYELTALYNGLDKATQQDLFGSYFSGKAQEIRISTRIQDSTEGLDRAALLESLHQELATLGLAEKDYTLSGLFVLYQDILTKLVDSQVITLIMVYSAMAIILMIIFSSLKIALIALVPNIITTMVIMGIMGWFAIPLDLMTITIATIAMGISMDDTIHYVHRYLAENDKSTNQNTIKATNLSVGYALIYTTMIIIVGFGMLVFSNFVPSMLFGLLTSIAMLIALITDITILPVMLKKWCRAG